MLAGGEMLSQFPANAIIPPLCGTQVRPCFYDYWPALLLEYLAQQALN